MKSRNSEHLLAAVVATLFLAACGSNGGDNDPASRASAFSYSEIAIDRFVTACMQQPEMNVAKCSCVLDKYRSLMDEGRFFEALNRTPTDEEGRLFAECGAGGAGLVRQLKAGDTPYVASPDSPAQSAASLPAGPSERAATSPEACVQTKVAAATAAAGGQAMPLAQYDKIRAECGA